MVRGGGVFGYQGDSVIASRASDGGEVLRDAEVIYSGSRFSPNLSWEPE